MSAPAPGPSWLISFRAAAISADSLLTLIGFISVSSWIFPSDDLTLIRADIKVKWIIFHRVDLPLVLIRRGKTRRRRRRRRRRRECVAVAAITLIGSSMKATTTSTTPPLNIQCRPIQIPRAGIPAPLPPFNPIIHFSQRWIINHHRSIIINHHSLHDGNWEPGGGERGRGRGTGGIFPSFRRRSLVRVAVARWRWRRRGKKYSQHFYIFKQLRRRFPEQKISTNFTETRQSRNTQEQKEEEEEEEEEGEEEGNWVRNKKKI